MEPSGTSEELNRRLDAANVLIAALRTREALLTESEQKYRTLFDSIDEGFCIIEVIFDADGKAFDLLHLEANEAYARYTGLKDIVGKRARAIVPDGGPWLDFYGNVARTGQAARLETYLPPSVDRWISSYASRVGGDGSPRVAVVFNDITDRKRAEAALRESEERQAFLLALADDLSRLSDPDEIMLVMADRIGAQLKLSTCVFADVDDEHAQLTVHQGWNVQGVPSLKQTFRMADYLTADFQRAARANEPLIIRNVNIDPRADAEACARLKVGAFALIPFHRNGRWTAFFAASDSKPRDWTPAEITLFREISDRVFPRIERARAEIALRDSEERFAQFANASASALWVRDAATLALEYASPAMRRIYGIEPDALLGPIERWASLITPDDRDLALERIETARRGEAMVHEFRIQRPSDRAFRWIRSTDFPLQASGRVHRIGGIVEDITEAKLAIEHQGVLLAELQHRVRNIMAMIRAITARTGERAESVADYADLLAGRLLALSRVQSLLTRAANVSVGIATIVHDEVSAQAQHEGQYVLAGPDLALSPKAAEVLTLAIHELATNALKYGALSVPNGKVTVTWTNVEKRGTPWLVFDWTEEGAPERRPPAADALRRRGFGSELIEGRVPYELKGRGKLTIEPGGARCQLEFPLQDGASILETGAPQKATVFGGALDMSGEPDLSGHRVLVVEDDYYLASDAARALQGAGAEVMGPCATEEDARSEVEQQRPDAVVLDINLGSGPSFKLAERLKDAGIPLVFTTGYDPEVIPVEFDGVERLQKPVELRRIVGAIARLLSKAV